MEDSATVARKKVQQPEEGLYEMKEDKDEPEGICGGHKQMHGDVIDIWTEQIKHRGRQPE
jgi:hypothetical protein